MKRSLEMGVERPSGPASARQLDFIERHDILRELDVSASAASGFIGNFIKTRRKLSPTAKQEALLRQKGEWRAGMTRGEAFDAIGRIFRDERAAALRAARATPANNPPNDTK